MPKHPHILKRDGRYYYRRRIPTDLVQAGCYGKAKDIKRALKTGDLGAANRLSVTLALQLDDEFRAKRRELEKTAQTDTSFKSAKRGRLVDLSKIEIADFITRIFITQERGEKRHWDDHDPESRKEILQIIGEDLSALDGELTDEQCDWFGKLQKSLEAEGISMDGTDKALVVDLAQKLQRAYVEAKWRTERALTGHPHESLDPLFKNVHADSEFPVAPKRSKTVGELYREYTEYSIKRGEGGRLAPSTVSKIKANCLIMVDFFGNDKQLTSISSDDATRLVDFLPTIPSNAAKRYKKLSLVAAAEQEAKLSNKQLIHPKTVDNNHGGLVAMLGHAVELGWIKENPLKSRLVRERLPRIVRRDRQMLTPDEMTRMFATPEFLSQRHGKLAARYWMPLLCLFHGTRSNEVATLLVANVKEDNGIRYLDLRETKEHRLKTESSARVVPLHQKLIDLGFLEFVAERRADDPTGYLFSDLSCNAHGNMASALNVWWARLVIKTLGAPAPGGSSGARGIHSLRHSWTLAARSAGLDDSIRKRLGGWSQIDASEGYGWAGALPMLKESINRIQFPGVTFPRVVRRIKRS